MRTGTLPGRTRPQYVKNMPTKTETKKQKKTRQSDGVFKFCELSKTARQHAIEKWLEGEPSHDWWEFT
jgi:hypothetical protein